MNPWQVRIPKKGEAILAAHFADIKSMLCEATIQPGSCSGIEVLRTPGGTTLAVSNQGNSLSVGIVDTGGITARSGTTPGVGSVDLYWLNNATPRIFVTRNITVTCYSISSTTGNVPAGPYVMDEQDDLGDWYLVSIDCGN